MRLASRTTSYSSFEVAPLSAACGAVITEPDFDLLKAYSRADVIQDIIVAVREHLVVAVPDQALTPAELSRLAGEFGQVCQAPFLREVDGAPGVVEVKREASQEGLPFFAGNWHSDWSFMETPPSYSLLYSVDVPPLVGSTLFANQQLAYENLSGGMKRLLADVRVVHSAGPSLHEQRRTVGIELEDSAFDEVEHAALSRDAATSNCALFLNDAYCIRLADWTVDESRSLLNFLFAWQTQPEFQCKVDWIPNMLVVWDNRAVTHRVMHDYDGTYRRLLRATVRS